MIAEFKRFASGMTPQQAEQEVNRLLQSGQMSKDQFEQLKQQAKFFMGFFK
nr:MAG TPA: Short C-terminal domain [Caudoviricetes sp.]